MTRETYFFENSINRNKNKLKPLVQVMQEIAIRTIAANRKQNIKSITREFIESWIAYNSRAYRIGQPRTNLKIQVAYRKNMIPILINIGNTNRRKSK
ncbi:hypothetical protein [Candidatus Liberibacter americanus]|uniref:Uncharacterized protein n=1 Tax=Candidatus Liberibacter americanus str. Sao Paulo TaxID=1261131 RepID=U6B3V8_9HYPH|nr:hypothetical protein [Candidatus Liberibacter americanus]AHA27625.1 hypothetical protein lam_254 [Candidatus Liberibacter americanus str. Sao Paulo]EMS36334.1 hypothetical protein G653_01623 [Candidatus Liberibacter americanus PW_SP]